MPPGAEREERRLQRQRGAGKRKVKDTAGFDLVLPGDDAAPLEPRRSGRTRKTPQPEVLPPQRSSRRTPASKAPTSQRSTKQTPANRATANSPSVTKDTSISHQVSSTGDAGEAHLPISVGKRKRPTGEEIFDVPDSPPPPDDDDRNLGAEKKHPPKKARVEEVAADSNIDTHNSAAGELLTNIQGHAEANGGALQKTATKKRKKRKSIGQQAPRRARAKLSPGHRDMKREPISSPTQLVEDGTSRLSEAPLEGKDPAEAQIRHELAGAAEEGLRDSLGGDTETNSSRRAPHDNRRTILRQPREERRPMTKKGPSKGSKLESDPHVYSLPASIPTDQPEAVFNDESQINEGQGSGGEEYDRDDEATNVKGRMDPRAPTAKMIPSPAKPKRKKRKSIGQQKPKRSSIGARVKAPATTGKEAAPSRSKSQTESEPQTTSNTTRKRPKAPAKSTTATGNSRAPPANSVPITMYRPSVPHHSAAGEAGLEIEAVNPDDHDPLTTPLPPAPNTLNAIDVLSQVTRELVAKTASNPQLSSRSRKTMQLYGQELESRMKQLGQALATNAALGKRVRDVLAEEKETRRQVKDVGSEIKGVREKIVEARVLRKEMRLANLLGEIAGWIGKGWEREKAIVTN